MKFDMLCNIILEGRKDRQSVRITVVNATPSFSMEDILKDPSDPSKGIRSYLDEKSKSDDGQPEDPERQARRALRRLNWVAKTAIKRVGRREIDIHKLHFTIMMVIEQYLTNVLRYHHEHIANIQLTIAKEAAFIGNLLLPPTNRHPSAKGVFGIVADTEFDTKSPTAEGPAKNKKVGKDGLTVSERIAKEFNMSVDEYIAAFDPDLLGTIKDIIRNGAITKNTAEEVAEPETTPEVTQEAVEDDEVIGAEPESEPEAGSEAEPTSEPEVEAEREADTGVSVEDIMKDPRIRNVYDSRIVRKVIKSMLSLGSVITNEQGKLILPEPGQEAWRSEFEGWKDAKDMEAVEELPDNAEIEQTFDENEPSNTELKDIEDEEDQSGVSTEDEVAAARLGYKKPKAIEDDEDKNSDDEDGEDKPWFQ